MQHIYEEKYNVRRQLYFVLWISYYVHRETHHLLTMLLLSKVHNYINISMLKTI